jgi:hypothetical protein
MGHYLNFKLFNFFFINFSNDVTLPNFIEKQNTPTKEQKRKHPHVSWHAMSKLISFTFMKNVKTQPAPQVRQNLPQKLILDHCLIVYFRAALGVLCKWPPKSISHIQV